MKRGVRMTQDLLDRVRWAVRWYQETHDRSFSFDRFCRDALESHLKKFQSFIGGGRKWTKPLKAGRPRVREERK